MRILFCGVGAIGSQAALLCRNLEATLVFVDFDRVESKNLLAQAHVKPSVGKNKAEALKLQLLNLHGVKTESFGVRVTRDNVAALCGGADLLVDCFDNQDSRRLLSDFARGAGKPLVHGAVSADGTFGLVRWDERFVPDAEDTAGQATCEGGAHLPLLGLLAATLARSVQDFIKQGVKRDALVNLSSVVPTTHH
ncbi:thiamine biosynthesis protein ThiF [Myxococcus llanfairpwllgwyngyllgogerychwyrndrobwllllantysiliogogogochensis]|uniref:Thiamine biosynthesis protein ThiF n=1 Tax=Myxococcus llanfairpwllgwyngyllgogerychwyrndrobwllllantysiliogogogochensis TaxID=2590453 RepID=A0A540X450_9BACT|nr:MULTISPECIES: ThiF family adenylyltransferase [Myxococcus]NTX36198.1 ThiF family adenylyltransferase [Myxococcus sp. CA033]TQF16041.1 thiamine biosynthesis protein ThiF [Myxococcus llanfairpwllgwyngyllgogerychwyrndrobwllllantysiliogogogochensis]